MTDPELIGYCEIHCQTERALFNREQINRMIELAGYPDNYVRSVDADWLSVKDPMADLCKRARQRLKEQSK